MMHAKEARELALVPALTKDIEDKIRAAALKGEYKLVIPAIGPIMSNILTQQGYKVGADFAFTFISWER